MQLEQYTKKQLVQMIEQQKNSMFAERKFYLEKISKLEEEIRNERNKNNG